MKKRLLLAGLAVVLVAAGVWFFFLRGDNGETPHVRDSFRAKMELKIYGVDIGGTMVRENREKLTVQVTSPEDLADFSVVFDKTNMEKPVRLQYKNLEYNVGEHASPVSEGVTVVAELLEQLSKQPDESEYTLHDERFGAIYLRQKQDDILITNDKSLTIRLYEFE